MKKFTYLLLFMMALVAGSCSENSDTQDLLQDASAKKAVPKKQSLTIEDKLDLSLENGKIYLVIKQNFLPLRDPLNGIYKFPNTLYYFYILTDGDLVENGNGIIFPDDFVNETYLFYLILLSNPDDLTITTGKYLSMNISKYWSIVDNEGYTLPYYNERLAMLEGHYIYPAGNHRSVYSFNHFEANEFFDFKGGMEQGDEIDISFKGSFHTTESVTDPDVFPGEINFTGTIENSILLEDYDSYASTELWSDIPSGRIASDSKKTLFPMSELLLRHKRN